MSVESFSKQLAYPELKQKAVSSRSFRTKIAPSNGGTFNCGQQISIDMPGNLAGQFYNFQQMYLKIKMTNATAAFELDRCGALGFIKSLNLTTAGTQIGPQLNAYNVLATALLDLDSSDEWKGSSGNVLLGTNGGTLRGDSVGAAEERTFCIPIVLTAPAMSTPHRMFPAFSLSSLRMDIVLEDIGIAVRSDGVPAPTFKEVELVCQMTELSPAAMAELDSRTGGQYNILCNAYTNSNTTVEADVTQHTKSLGFSMSSLERILIVQRPQATTTSAAAYSLGNRCVSTLDNYQFLINNETYPMRPIKVEDKCAEAMAELLISDHSLTDFNKGCGLQNGVVESNVSLAVGANRSANPNVSVVSSPYSLANVAASGTTAGGHAVVATAAADSNIGTWLGAVEFESGLSHGSSSHIYSGISTVASNVQCKLMYGNVPYALTVDFFALSTILLSLDMRGSGTWSVSV